jgi:hypothetical protein
MKYPERYRDEYVPLEFVEWDVTGESRAWHGDEAQDSYFAMPERIEMMDGKLFWDGEERLKMLGALLENIGIDRAIRFGDPALWRAAVADLPD